MRAAPDQTLAIASATVDYASRQVTIVGSNFSPSGEAPNVALGSTPVESASLRLVSFSNESASVQLPATWTAGSYLLAITNSYHQTSTYTVTLNPPFSTIWNKARFHAAGLWGPWAIGGTFAYAGLLQELNAPREWGYGWSAYGRRVASTEACGIIHGTLAFGLDTTLHEDPRYFRADSKGFWRRMGHAAKLTVMTRTDAGGETFSAWRFGSAYGAAFISNLWYPDRLDTVRLGFEQGSLRMGFDFVSNVAAEFWPTIKKKLHRHSTISQPAAL